MIVLAKPPSELLLSCPSFQSFCPGLLSGLYI
jgi:hypothetical protein